MLTIGFTRTGNGVYIPHVDVLRSLNRTFRRAELAVNYSKGFNKHMVLKMTQPLPFGIADKDCWVTADADVFEDLTQVPNLFNVYCPPFLHAKRVFVTEKNPSLAGTVKASSYFLRSEKAILFKDALEKLQEEFFVEFDKKGVKEKKEVHSLIYRLKVNDDGIHITCAFGNVNLRIDAVYRQINDDFGLKIENTDVFRTEQLVEMENKWTTVQKYMERICQEKFILTE